MTTFRTTFALTVAAVLAGVSLTFASSAGAAPADESQRAGGVYFGAIALASDGAFGYSFDFRTKQAALNAAHQRCRQRSDYPGTCTKVGWIRNACGAVSVKYDRRGLRDPLQVRLGRHQAHRHRPGEAQLRRQDPRLGVHHAPLRSSTRSRLIESFD